MRHPLLTHQYSLIIDTIPHGTGLETLTAYARCTSRMHQVLLPGTHTCVVAFGNTLNGGERWLKLEVVLQMT